MTTKLLKLYRYILIILIISAIILGSIFLFVNINSINNILMHDVEYLFKIPETNIEYVSSYFSEKGIFLIYQKNNYIYYSNLLKDNKIFNYKIIFENSNYSIIELDGKYYYAYQRNKNEIILYILIDLYNYYKVISILILTTIISIILIILTISYIYKLLLSNLNLDLLLNVALDAINDTIVIFDQKFNIVYINNKKNNIDFKILLNKFIEEQNRTETIYLDNTFERHNAYEISYIRKEPYYILMARDRSEINKELLKIDLVVEQTLKTLQTIEEIKNN